MRAENISLSLTIGWSSVPSHRHAEEIAKAGRRAAVLTRQLLAFSRKQGIQPVVLDLNTATRELEKKDRAWGGLPDSRSHPWAKA